MWTLTDFRRKLLRFDRPVNPNYHVSNIPKFYSNHLDWDKMYVSGPKLANSCQQTINHINYPVLYEEHPGGDCGARNPTRRYYATKRPVPLGNTRFLVLLLILAVTFVMMAKSR